MNFIRQDIAYAISRLSRYTHNANRQLGMHQLESLDAFKGQSISTQIKWTSHVLEGYSDANWILNNDDIKLTNDMFLHLSFPFFLGGRG